MPQAKKYFRDPIHAFIEVSGPALEIVNCPYFQRLRRIKQLSFTNLVYHGAEHSRFGHSLGAYHLASRLADRLLPETERTIKQEFSLAALLHDIGHHPLSHAFESALTSNQDANELGYKHENYTESIIKNTEVGDYIENSGLSKANVIDLINGHYMEKPEFAYLNDLVSSELDVDRLDYLQRDSFYCGVPYGKLDLDRIILSLESENDEIIVGEKGIHSVEMYILARFFMYTQVYLHHTSRAFVLMLSKIFSKDVLDSINYPEPQKGQIERIVGFDDFWLRHQLAKLSGSDDDLQKTLAIGLLARDPIRWVMQKQAFADAQTLSTDPDYAKIENLENDKKDIAKLAEIEPESLYFDTPWKDIPFENRYRPYSMRQDQPAIKVCYRGEISDIAMTPSSLAFYLAKYMAQVIRIYTLKEHRKAVAEALAHKYPDLKQYLWRAE